MDDRPPDDISCTVQHFVNGTPTSEWLPDQLIAYVNALKAAIDDDERGQSIKYWRMGTALNFLRRSFNHGQWERFLSSAKLDKTKVSRSRAIARTFEHEADLTGLTVKEAYAKRSRKPREQASAVAAEAGEPHPRLAKFFRAAAREADALADEAAFADTAAAADLLSVAEAALSGMQRLCDLLSQQASDRT